MDWFNIFGAAFLAAIMIPNMIYAIGCKEGFVNKWHSKPLVLMEQIGRFGCFGFMVIQIPGTWFGWWSEEAFAAYLIADTLLVALYCVLWAVFWKKNTVFKALALSILPSLIFLFSGIMSRSVLLVLSAMIFAPSHILISYKNAKA